MTEKRTFAGSQGKVWVNGKYLGALTKIELKVTGNFEEIKMCDRMGTSHFYSGWTGDGTISLIKADSWVLSMLANAYKTGSVPDIKIITSLTEAATGQTERVAVTDVVFTEFMLASFEAGGITKEDIPLKFGNFEILETVD